MVADALSRRYVLFSTLDARLLGFEQLKELYEHDRDFKEIFRTCSKHGFNKFYIFEGYLFRENKLCVPNCSIRELLVREGHSGGLMSHFDVLKTLSLLQEHFYWPNMKRDVVKIKSVTLWGQNLCSCVCVSSRFSHV